MKFPSMVSCQSTLVVFLAFGFGILVSSPATAQVRDRGLPAANYYLGFGDFYSADYGDALKHFVRGSNSAFKIGPDERFLDSVCYWTMAGECHFHMGNYTEAIALYEQAINLVIYYAEGGWQKRVQLRAIQKSTSAEQQAKVNWYRSTRGNAYATIPRSFSMLFGRLDASRVFSEGGVLQNPEIRSVDHAEIMRCTALAIYRRYSIKGTTSHIDPFTTKMVSGMRKLSTTTAVLGKWNSIVRGLSEMSKGSTQNAVKRLEAGLQFQDGLDHHLTPIGLLALGKIAFLSGEEDAAQKRALEASPSAAIFNQYDLVEDALQLGTTLHLGNARSVYPPIVPAIDWARRSRSRKLLTSLIIQLTDCLIESNNADEATAALAQTKQAMNGTDLARSPIGGQIRFLNAAITFLNNGDGLPDLTRALESFKNSSLWLYRLRLVDASLAAGSITQRQAEAIYENLLLDPGDKQWKYNPQETIAYITSPHLGSMEQWFEILRARKNHEKAIQAAERIRRHRFYASLPLAGRLLTLRWMLSAPEERLDPIGKQQRREFLGRNPEFAQSNQRIRAIEQKLRTLPLKPDEDSPQKKEQQDLLVELLKLSGYQESVYQAVALTRQPANFVFPPAVDYSQLAENLSEKQVVISALKTASGYHLYAITQQSRRYLGVIRDRDMRRSVGKLYKSLGISDPDNAVEIPLLTGTDWKQPAAELKQLIFENYHDDQWENFDELIVIPDGILWYVPFEILQTGSAEDDWKSLSETINIRYLPMASMLAAKRPKSQSNSNRIATVTGKMHPKAELEITKRGFEDLSDAITTASKFDRQSKIPSNLLNSCTDTMLVWHTLESDNRNGAYSLAPFFLDKGRNGSSIGQWMLAPWRGVDSVVLPAFSSNAAAGIRSRSDGSELFLTTCGLLASGTQRILISRWNPGGKSAVDLSREFVAKTRDMSASAALIESSQTIRESEVSVADEIRVKTSAKSPASLKAEHPFFWAGNLLVDMEGFKATGTADSADADADADDDADADQADAKDAADASDDDDPSDPSEEEPSGSGTKESDSADDGSGKKPESENPEQSETPEEGSGTKEEGSGTREEGSGTTEEGSAQK